MPFKTSRTNWAVKSPGAGSMRNLVLQWSEWKLCFCYLLRDVVIKTTRQNLHWIPRARRRGQWDMSLWQIIEIRITPKEHYYGMECLSVRGFDGKAANFSVSFTNCSYCLARFSDYNYKIKNILPYRNYIHIYRPSMNLLKGNCRKLC